MQTINGSTIDLNDTARIVHAVLSGKRELLANYELGLIYPWELVYALVDRFGREAFRGGLEMDFAGRLESGEEACAQIYELIFGSQWPRGVRRITGDVRGDIEGSIWCVEYPSSHHLEHALQRLDASTHTILEIQDKLGEYLIIGGGGGRYIVCVSFDHEQFWNMVGDESTVGTEALKVGGQDYQVPAALVVTMEQALAAGLGFMRRETDPMQRWLGSEYPPIRLGRFR